MTISLLRGRFQAHILQIVLPGALDDNAVVGVNLNLGFPLGFFRCSTQFLYFLLPLRVLAAAFRSLASAAVGVFPAL